MRLFSLLTLMLLSVQLYAIPARSTYFKARMSDGTYMMLRFMGDEHASFYVSESGYIAERNEDGIYTLTSYRVDDMASQVRKRAGIGAVENAPLQSSGAPNIPVILVNFSDLGMTVASTSDSIRMYYDKFCNGTRDGVLYNGAGSYGAVKDYFAHQSDSLFLPEFKVLGPVTLSKEMAYYGKNSGAIKDVNFSDFCDEALNLVMNMEDDFLSAFDNDKNGTVDMAFFIYAGLPESDHGVTEDAIWPKEQLAERIINGIKVSVSACCSEQSLNSRGVGVPSGVGTMCHEVAHSVGLPDTYDTSYKNLGMSYWSLMDSGNYCNSGKTPCGLTGYERDFLNWRRLEIIDKPATIRLHALEKGGTAYKVVNDASVGGNEYYVLENRQQQGWDTALTGVFNSGMLITHVDYDKNAWTGNRLNVNASHQHMTFIPANNNYIGPYTATNSAELIEALSGQLYTTGGALTDMTLPASKVYTGGYMYKDIKQVCQHENGDITFKFMPLGILESPLELMAEDVNSKSFVVCWSDVTLAECYGLEVYGVNSDLVADEDSLTLIYQQDSICATSHNIILDKVYSKVAFRVVAKGDTYEDSPWTSFCYVDMTLNCVERIQTKQADTDGVYTLGGIRVGNDVRALESMPSGVYVLRKAGHTQLQVISK